MSAPWDDDESERCPACGRFPVAWDAEDVCRCEDAGKAGSYQPRPSEALSAPPRAVRELAKGAHERSALVPTDWRGRGGEPVESFRRTQLPPAAVSGLRPGDTGGLTGENVSASVAKSALRLGDVFHDHDPAHADRKKPIPEVVADSVKRPSATPHHSNPLMVAPDQYPARVYGIRRLRCSDNGGEFGAERTLSGHAAGELSPDTLLENGGPSAMPTSGHVGPVGPCNRAVHRRDVARARTPVQPDPYEYRLACDSPLPPR